MSEESTPGLIIAVAAELRICEETFECIEPSLEPDPGEPGSIWLARDRAIARLRQALQDAHLDLYRARRDIQRKLDRQEKGESDG